MGDVRFKELTVAWGMCGSRSEMCVVAIPESSGDTYLEPETPRHPYFWSHAGNLRALKVANGEKTGNYGVLPMIKIKIWRRRERR